MIRRRPEPLDDGLPFSKQRSRPVETVDTRVRSPRHLDNVRRHRCCVCGRHPTVAHHMLDGPEPKARGEKASDIYAVPLCIFCHDPNAQGGVHHDGNETRWTRERGVNFHAIAYRIACDSVRKGWLTPEQLPKEAA